MSDEMAGVDDGENYYNLVPEQGLCLVGNDIVNLKKVSVIRKLDGKTLVYDGSPEPIIMPLRAFDQIRDAVFAIDDLDDEEEDLDEEE